MKFADMVHELLRRRGAAWIDDGDDVDLQEDDRDLQKEIDDDMRDVATRSGIAEVDPEPISHTAGEGIDLDRDVEAHEKIREQRERMPDPSLTPR